MGGADRAGDGRTEGTTTLRPDPGPTTTELKIAAMVRDGAGKSRSGGGGGGGGGPEFATRLLLSVKTVDATRVFPRFAAASVSEITSRA